MDRGQGLDYKRGYSDLQKPGQAKWLQDDYVKFLRLAEWEIARSTSGVLGFITNHAWLENPTFKGMRKHLLESFDRRTVLDLHGNANKKETAPNGRPDENVFDIKQGVAISALVRRPSPVFDEKWVTQRSDLLGVDTFKFDTLLSNTTRSLASESFRALPPDYIFDRRNERKKAEYEQFPSIPSIFNQNGDPAPGIVTTQDQFAISFTVEEQIEKVEALLETRTEVEARKLFRLCSQKQWNYRRAKRELRREKWREKIARILYRPFDVRVTVFNRHVAVHRRERVSRHMLAGDNVGFITTRQTKDEWGALATSIIIAHKTCSAYDINSLFPLYLYPGVGKVDRALFGRWPNGEGGRTPNLDSRFVEQMADATELHFVSDGRGDLWKTFGPEDILAWIYAVFYSPAYRKRYEVQLKRQFPRVPLPRSPELFRKLAETGHELLVLHVFEFLKLDEFITSYTGPRNPEVGRVGWSDGTVWLDATKTRARARHRATKPGTIALQGVPEQVWDFHIGGFQVCHKWLKDRKGRMLSDEEIAHYQRIVVAISKTIHIMTEVDKVIEAHGGWPGAFRTGPEADAVSVETTKMVPFRPSTVEPELESRYVTSVPLVPLRAAASGFSDPQHVEDGDFEWVDVKSFHRLRKGMFVAQVVGKSMQPAIADGAWCLFRAPVDGTRQGKIVLVQLRDAIDPETGNRYTVKRYKSEKTTTGDSWHHRKITLKTRQPGLRPDRAHQRGRRRIPSSCRAGRRSGTHGFSRRGLIPGEAARTLNTRFPRRSACRLAFRSS